jgi:copper(I)-binding protein
MRKAKWIIYHDIGITTPGRRALAGGRDLLEQCALSKIEPITMPAFSFARSFSGFLLACLFAVPIAASAADPIRVTDPWARATVPGQKVAGAYMRIVSTVDAKLVAVSSPVAGSAEIHWMKMEDGTMRMRSIDALDLPAGQVVELAPGGYHVMLFGLKQALAAGDRIAITLDFETATGQKMQMPVSAEVRARDDPAKH